MQIRVPGELAATIRKQAKADQRTIHNLILLALRQWVTEKAKNGGGK